MERTNSSQITRRHFLSLASKLPFLIAGCKNKPDTNQNNDTQSLESFARGIAKESLKFPELSVDQPQIVTTGTDPKELSFQKIDGPLQNFGLESFAIAWNFASMHDGQLTIVVKTSNQARLGANFTGDKTTPPPALLVLGKDNVYSAFTTQSHSVVPFDAFYNAPLDFLIVNFPTSKGILEGKSFAVHFTTGLFKYNGDESQGFSLPYRFSIKTFPSRGN